MLAAAWSPCIWLPLSLKWTSSRCRSSWPSIRVCWSSMGMPLCFITASARAFRDSMRAFVAPKLLSFLTAVMVAHRSRLSGLSFLSPFLFELMDHGRKRRRECWFTVVPPVHPIVEVDYLERGSCLKVHMQLGRKPWIA